MNQELNFIEEDQGIVTLGSGYTTIYLPSVIENDQASFTIDESCECVYSSSEDERVVACKKGDRVLVVTMNWDDDIEKIMLLGVSPDNHMPSDVN